jgi:hypothetical protein
MYQKTKLTFPNTHQDWGKLKRDATKPAGRVSENFNQSPLRER